MRAAKNRAILQQTRRPDSAKQMKILQIRPVDKTSAMFVVSTSRGNGGGEILPNKRQQLPPELRRSKHSVLTTFRNYKPIHS